MVLHFQKPGVFSRSDIKNPALPVIAAAPRFLKQIALRMAESFWLFAEMKDIKNSPQGFRFQDSLRLSRYRSKWGFQAPAARFSVGEGTVRMWGHRLERSV